MASRDERDPLPMSTYIPRKGLQQEGSHLGARKRSRLLRQQILNLPAQELDKIHTHPVEAAQAQVFVTAVRAN